MKALGYILIVIGSIVLVFSTVGSIGYGLYVWGGTGIPFAESAWTAFVLWMKLAGGGLVSTLIGFFLSYER